MSLFDYARFPLALLAVLGLMALTLWAIKHFRLAGPVAGERRLRILEVRPLDPRTRLVLATRDHVEHLILIHPSGAALIESRDPREGGDAPTSESDPSAAGAPKPCGPAP